MYPFFCYFISPATKTANVAESTTTIQFELNDYFSISAGALTYAKKNKLDYTVTNRNIKQIAFIIIAVGIVLAIAVFAIVLMMRNKKGASLSVKKAQKIEEQQQ